MGAARVLPGQRVRAGAGECCVQQIATRRDWLGLDAQRDANGGVLLPAGSIGLDEARGLLRGADVELLAFFTRPATLERALIERLRRRGRRS